MANIGCPSPQGPAGVSSSSAGVRQTTTDVVRHREGRTCERLLRPSNGFTCFTLTQHTSLPQTSCKRQTLVVCGGHSEEEEGGRPAEMEPPV